MMKTIQLFQVWIGLVMITSLVVGPVTICAQGDSDLPIDGVWQIDELGWIGVIEDTMVTIYEATEAGCLQTGKYPYAAQGITLELVEETLILWEGDEVFDTAHRLDMLPVECLNGGTSTSEQLATDGIWLTNGYGWVLVAEGGLATQYELTAVSCLPIDQFAYAAEGMTFDLVDDNTLVVQSASSLYFTANRLEVLPDLCLNGGTPYSDDPELNFEVFWRTFDEHYASFDLHNIDWAAQYDLYRPQITPETTPDELWTIFVQMLTPVRDSHVYLDSPNDSFSPINMPEWDPIVPPEIIALQTIETIGETYLGGYVTANEELEVSGDEVLVPHESIFYGKLSDTVGYINIMNMDSEDPEVIALLDNIIAEWAGMDTIIIDVRFNLGGNDATSLQYAGRFADQERLAYSKQAVDGEGYTPSRDLFVTPSGPQQFTGNVIVLTSKATVSAAEIFVMAMRVLPHVTLVGMPSNGAHSDILGRTLPNGWEIGLSNEVYTLADGQIYESVGIPVDVEAAIDPATLEVGRDHVLDTALAFIAEQ